jgi:hypothetical protein
MRWYLKINNEELSIPEAMNLLEDIKSKDWQDYLILPGESGFNVMRSLEEILKDPEHVNQIYQVVDSQGHSPTHYAVAITGTKATFNGLMMDWSDAANVTSLYFRDNKELDYIEKFGLKNPILIQIKI